MEAPRHMGHRGFPMVRSCLTPNGRVGRRQRWNRMHERSALPLDDKAVGISQMPLRASFRVPDNPLGIQPATGAAATGLVRRGRWAVHVRSLRMPRVTALQAISATSRPGSGRLWTRAEPLSWTNTRTDLLGVCIVHLGLEIVNIHRCRQGAGTASPQPPSPPVVRISAGSCYTCSLVAHENCEE